MKKVFIFIILFSILTYTITADDLADLLQDLAVQTACLGRYSIVQANKYVTTRYNDPPDYYEPPLLASRFAAMSGNMTRTITFYGVCFDYAQFAWDDIKKYQKMYNKAGMKNQQWYIASTDKNNPYNIILYDPVSKEKATIIMNGIYLKENSRYKIYAHDGAEGHAWIWVQHNNGTWYWIDPTWTDNTGYVWWGMVKDGKEVQYYPDPDLCVASNYPKPYIASDYPTYTPNTTYNNSQNSKPTYNEKPNPEKPKSVPSNNNSDYFLMFGYNYIKDMPYGITIAVTSLFFDKSLTYISANLGFDSFKTIEGNINNIPYYNNSSYYSSYRRIDWEKFIIEWVYGFSIAINEYFRIPIGIGGNHINLSPSGISSSGYYTDSEKPEEEWQHKLVLEVGIQPVLFKKIALTATYRLKGFSESYYAMGIGIMF